MAKAPVPSNSSRSLISKLGVGPSLVGFGVVVILLTRIITWLPLSFLGTGINSLLWPIAIISIVAGGVVTYLKSKRS